MKMNRATDFIRRKMNLILLITVLAGLSVAGGTGIVVFEQRKMNGDMERMDQLSNMTSNVLSVMGNVAGFAVKGDPASAHEVTKKILKLRAAVLTTSPEDRLLYNATLSQVNILFNAMSRSKSVNYRNQLSVSVRNLAFTLQTTIIEKETSDLHHDLMARRTLLTFITDGLIGLVLIVAVFLLLIIILTTAQFRRSLIGPISELEGKLQEAASFIPIKSTLQDDLFELRELDNAVVESVSTIRSIIDSIPYVGLVLVDATPDNRILFTNRHMAEMYKSLVSELRDKGRTGISSSLEIGSSIHQFHENPDRIRNIFKAIQPGQVRKNMTISLGSNVLESYSVSIVNAEGETKYYLGIFFDKSTVASLKSATTKTSESLDQLSHSQELVAGIISSMQRSASETEERMQELMRDFKMADDAFEGLLSAIDTVNTKLPDVNKVLSDLVTVSHSITDVTGSINAIAEQTRMLSLNAAIEAARAGREGRGFAVVAEEVRKLSGNTANLVSSIDEKVTNVSEEVDRISKALFSLTALANDASTHSIESRSIFSSVREALESVNMAFQKVDDLSKSATGETNKQSKILRQTLDEYDKVKEIQL